MDHMGGTNFMENTTTLNLMIKITYLLTLEEIEKLI